MEVTAPRLPKTSRQVAVDRPIAGHCHCGTVQFRVQLRQDGLLSARRCNCSICRMRGAVAVSAPLGQFELLSGQDALTLYQFNTGTAKHYFCSRCGIYTHHQRRSVPTEYAVNVACLEGLSPFHFEEVPVLDGAGGHPSDAEHQPQGSAAFVLAGVQKFEPGPFVVDMTR